MAARLSVVALGGSAMSNPDATQVASHVQCGTQLFTITNGLIAAYRELTGVPSNADALVLLGGRALAKPTPRQVKMGGVVSARHHGLTRTATT